MMLTIHGLPIYVKYQDLKALVKQECNIVDFFFDNLIAESDTTKKVRIALSNEREGAYLMKCLDGFRMAGHLLKVVPVGKPQMNTQGNLDQGNYQQRKEYGSGDANYNWPDSGRPNLVDPVRNQAGLLSHPETLNIRTDLMRGASGPLIGDPMQGHRQPMKGHLGPMGRNRNDASQIRPDPLAGPLNRPEGMQGRPVPMGRDPVQGRPTMAQSHPDPWNQGGNQGNQWSNQTGPGRPNPQNNYKPKPSQPAPFGQQTEPFAGRAHQDGGYGFARQGGAPLGPQGGLRAEVRPHVLRSVEIVDEPLGRPIVKPPAAQPAAPMTISKENFQGSQFGLERREPPYQAHQPAPWAQNSPWCNPPTANIRVAPPVPNPMAQDKPQFPKSSHPFEKQYEEKYQGAAPDKRKEGGYDKGPRFSPRRDVPRGRMDSPADRRREESPRARYSPRRDKPPDKYPLGPPAKDVRPAYDGALQAPNQMYSGGYRPGVHESVNYPPGRSQDPPWQERYKKDDVGEPRSQFDRDANVMEKRDRLGRSPVRRAVERSPPRDRYVKRSMSPPSGSPRRSWALEKRRSPEAAPPPPMWTEPAQDEYRRNYVADDKKRSAVWDRPPYDKADRGREDVPDKGFSDGRGRAEPRRTSPDPARPRERDLSPRGRPDDRFSQRKPVFEPRDPKFAPRREPEFEPRDPKLDSRLDLSRNPNTIEQRRDPNYEMNDPKFERNVDPKFISRDPKFEPRRDSKFEPRRDPLFEPRIDPKFEPRRDPKFEPRIDPKFEPRRDPKFESRRDPNYPPEGPNEPRRDPKFEPRRDPIFSPRDHNEPTREPKFEPRREPNFEPRDPKFDQRDSKFDQRDPKFEPRREPQFQPRDYKFDARDPKFEPRRDPKFEPRESRDPKFEPRDTRDPKFEPREARDPKFEPRETRDPKFEPRDTRDPKFEPRDTGDPKFEPRDIREPQFKPREPVFEGKASRFEPRKDFDDHRERRRLELEDIAKRYDKVEREPLKVDPKLDLHAGFRRDNLPRPDEHRKLAIPKTSEFNQEFDDVYKRSLEFKQKVEELRRSAGRRRENTDDGRNDRRLDNRGDDRRVEDRKGGREEDREDHRRVDSGREDWKRVERDAKRDKAIEEISLKMIDKYGSNYNKDQTRRVLEELKKSLTRIFAKMFEDRDVSFIEMVVKFNARHDDKAIAKIYNDVMESFPAFYRKRHAEGERDEIPAKASRLSSNVKRDEPKRGPQPHVPDWSAHDPQQVSSLMQQFDIVPQLVTDMRGMLMPMASIPPPMLQPVMPLAPLVPVHQPPAPAPALRPHAVPPRPLAMPAPRVPESPAFTINALKELEKESCSSKDDHYFNLYLCKDDFEPYSSHQSEYLKKFLVSQIIAASESSSGWTPDFTLKGLQSLYRYELVARDEETRSWIINLDFSEFQYFNVLVYTKEELWYERAAIWLPGHSRTRIEPLDKLRLQNQHSTALNIGKWKLVKKIVTAKGTRLYVDMPPSAARALEAHKMTLSYELQKANVFLKAVAVDKDAFDMGLREPSLTDEGAILTAVQNSPMPSVSPEPNVVKIALKGNKTVTLQQARKIKEMLIYRIFKYHQESGTRKTDFVKFGFCMPGYFAVVPENSESRRWLEHLNLGKLNKHVIVVLGAEDSSTKFIKVNVLVHRDVEGVNAPLMLERLKLSNQGVKGLHFSLWKAHKAYSARDGKVSLEMDMDVDSLDTLSRMHYKLDYIDGNKRQHTAVVRYERSYTKLEELIRKYKSELSDSYDVANMDLESASEDDDIICMGEVN